jgi:hypothetical protein
MDNRTEAQLRQELAQVWAMLEAERAAALAAQPAEPVAWQHRARHDLVKAAPTEWREIPPGDAAAMREKASNLPHLHEVRPVYAAPPAPAAVPPDERVRVLRELVTKALALCGDVAEQQSRPDDSWEAEAAEILAALEQTNDR